MKQTLDFYKLVQQIEQLPPEKRNKPLVQYLYEHALLKSLCFSFCELHDIPFNGNVKELCIDLGIKTYLKQDSSIEFMYLELQATFPEISKALMTAFDNNPPPHETSLETNDSSLQAWILSIKEILSPLYRKIPTL